MFARINTVKQGDKTYQYLQILESSYHQGQSRQRVVANLGRIDLLGDQLERSTRSTNIVKRNW